MSIGSGGAGLVLQNDPEPAEERPVAPQNKSPFARVSNGYDPAQVAAFAAEALSWKKELTALRAELAAAVELVNQYEADLDDNEDVEREARVLVEDAERRAAQIIEDAKESASEIIEAAESEAAAIRQASPSRGPEFSFDSPAAQPSDHDPLGGVAWLATPDPVDDIFEPIDDDQLVDAETDRERRIAAATANLWKRRGVLAPPE